MRQELVRCIFLLSFIGLNITGFSQENGRVPGADKRIIDSLRNSGVIFHQERNKPDISLNTEQAIRFLKQRIDPKYWHNAHDPFRTALNQLVFEASNQRFDSAEVYLNKFPYDSLFIPWDKFYVWEPLKLKIPVISPPAFPMRVDSAAMEADSIRTDSLFATFTDTTRIRPFNPDQPVLMPGTVGLKDTTILVVIDTLYNVTSPGKSFPFRYAEYPYQGDSIKVAVKLLLEYLEKRDSSIVKFTGVGNNTIPVWMNSVSNRNMRRYWLKNEFNDSVTVWIGNEDKNTFGLYLEQGINFRKPIKQNNYSEARINVQSVDKSNLKKQDIFVKKHYWNYKTESSLIFSQSAMSNWVRGGENSVSTALDVTGYADFKRPELKLTSSNFARLKLGFLKSGGNDIRKNLDLLETNSKLNYKAFGKFDFSAIMLFKTQVATGKAYTKVSGRDTSYMVSKFLNPAVLTIGIGLDYKPDKETSINFSPLSYKGTFVPAAGMLDKNTVLKPGQIDQTRYGIPYGKKSLNEPGASFQISKVSKVFENLTVTNRLQLFTNYIHNPQNIDIDWEMIAVAKLNWFTDVRFNTQLIFDDDTKTTVMEGGKPVMLEDGSGEKKSARVQFKELFGISLVFRF